MVLSFVDLHDNPKIPFRDYMPFLTQCQEWKGITKVSMTSMKVLLMNFIVLLSRNNQKRKILLFASSLRHVKNIDKMLQCEQCGSWRLLYCEQKVTKKERERENLEEGLADVSFTRGAPLQDLQLPGRLANVYVRDISCEEPIERLYYTAKYPLICVYCANPLDTNSNYPDSDGCFPQCGGCKDRPNIKVMYFMSVDIGIRQKIRSHYMYDVAWWASCVATVGPRGGLFSNLMWHVAW